MSQVPIVITSLPQPYFSAIERVHSAAKSCFSSLKCLSISNATDPLRIWIIQVGVIMITTQLLSLPLKKIHQPRVIAEVLGGIVLSPSILGRIPGFTRTIFPDSSKPFLLFAANIGLILFLFLIGLEIDGRMIRRNARISMSIALSGMIIPFGLGATLSVALYKEFIDPDTNFFHFLLLTGVAFSITAFPVLCRILTELKLLDTIVGIVVISAGVINDIVGWTLLALSVALANAASGLTALWILLTCVGWSVFILVCVRWILYQIARRTGSIENGPTTFFIMTTIFMVLSSAFVTDAIGVHPIIGSFVVGLVIPREGGLAISITEKLEDMVSIIFLPLYFVQSGLSTDFRLLDKGVIWAYMFAIISLAWVGKFGSCTVAAKLSGFQWREAASIGTLMSCKGLIELIVLNVGLSAGILNTRVFSMFVLEALVLTFMTTPVVVALYPFEYRSRATPPGANSDTLENTDNPPDKDVHSPYFYSLGQDERKTRFMVVLDRLEHIPSIMALTKLLQPFMVQPDHSGDRSIELTRAPSESRIAKPSSSIQALRLIELSDRTSAVMKSSIASSLIHTDSLLNVFDTFCDIMNIPMSSSLSVVPFDDLATKVLDHAQESLSDLILLSWLPYVPISTIHSPRNETRRCTGNASATSDSKKASDTPLQFDMMEPSSSTLHSQFLRSVFAGSKVDVALYVDRGRAGPGPYEGQCIILPFFGGPDDRLALAMVIQLCRHPNTTAKVFRLTTSRPAAVDEPMTAAQDDRQLYSAPELLETTDGNTTTQVQLESETADHMLWQSFTSPSSCLRTTLATALEQIDFIELESRTPLRDVIARVQIETEIALRKKAKLFIIAGRGGRFRTETHGELNGLLEEIGQVRPEVRNVLGDVGTSFVVSGTAAGLVIVQSKHRY